MNDFDLAWQIHYLTSIIGQGEPDKNSNMIKTLEIYSGLIVGGDDKRS